MSEEEREDGQDPNSGEADDVLDSPMAPPGDPPDGSPPPDDSPGSDEVVVDSPVSTEEAPDGPDGAAHCAIHAHSVSTGVCSHCGNFGCDDCLGYLDGRLVCHTCVFEKRVDVYEGVPWERRQELGRWTAMWRTVADVTTKPKKLFEALDPKGSITEPLLFLVTALLPASAVWAVLILGVVLIVALSEGGAGGAEMAIVAVVAVVVPLFLPLVFVSVTLIGGLIHHLLLMLVGGGSKGLTATLRASIYGGGVAFWIVVPCVYYVISYWQMAMNIIGYAAVHKEPHWKAIVAVFGPLCLCGGGYLLLILVMAAAGEL